MGGPSFPVRVVAGVSLLTVVYYGCVLDRDGLLEPSGTASGTTSIGGMGGLGGSGATGADGGMGGSGGAGAQGGGGGVMEGGGGTGGVLNGGGGAGGDMTTDPSDIPGCILWLRADTGVTQNAGEVTSWANQCGPGQAIQPNPMFQPTLLPASGPNATAALDFIRTEMDHMSLALSDPSQSYTLYVVLDQQLPTTSIQAIFTSNDTAGQNRFFTVVDPAANGNGVGVNEQSGSYLECFSSVAGPQWLSWRIDESASTLSCARHDGTTGSVGLSNPWTWAGTQWLGSFKLTTHSIDALLSEIFMFNRIINPAEQAEIEGYLAARYGL